VDTAHDGIASPDGLSPSFHVLAREIAGCERADTRPAQRRMTWRSAGEIALVADGTVSAREAVDAHIDRIEVLDDRLNAVVARRFDDARAEATAVDAARARGETWSAAGVPMTVKEQFDVKGLATTFGLPKRRDELAEADRPLVTACAAPGRSSSARRTWPSSSSTRRATTRSSAGPTTPGPGADGRRRAAARRDHRGRRLTARAWRRHRRQHPDARPLLRDPRSPSDVRS
jgi:hypothetical protein